MDAEAIAIAARLGRDYVTVEHPAAVRFHPHPGDVLLVARHMLASTELVQVGPELAGRTFWTVIRADDEMAAVWLQYAVLCDAAVVDVVSKDELVRRIRGGKGVVDGRMDHAVVSGRSGTVGAVGRLGDVEERNRFASRIRCATALGGR